LLLDTSVILRIGIAPGSLTAAITEGILVCKAIFVPSVARAEIGIKLSIGKLTLPVEEKRYWKEITSRLQAQELPFSCAHAALLSQMPLHHRDPFDRMIAAQCLQEGLVLASTDTIFRAYGVKMLH